jgi:hypothetical protein
MRRLIIPFIVLSGLLVAASGCNDAPTAPDATERSKVVAGDAGISSSILLEPVIVRGCDPTITECDDDAGWGSCASGGQGTLDPEMGSTESCPGGGGSGAGGDGGSVGGGTGGDGTPSDPYEDGCNPQVDPECNQPLTSADSVALMGAFALHLRPAAQFTDASKAAQCSQMKAEFDRLMAAGDVYRGKFDTPPNDSITPVHVGAYDPVSKTIHFEPSAMDAANRGDPDAIRNVVNTALHEAAHSLGLRHSDPVWMGSYDLYAEAPFNLLSPGSNSCITNW